MEETILTPDQIENLMSVVALATNAHWFPQCTRLINRKESDDFSLWTTVILLANNLAWWFYASYIDSQALMLQQGLTICMLLFFAGLIIRYRTTPLFFSDDVVLFMRNVERKFQLTVVFGILFPLVGIWVLFRAGWIG